MRRSLRGRLASFRDDWASRADDTVTRPTDSPRASASGYDMDRVLILGTGPASGWGVTTHDLALPGALARAIAARTGRGAGVEVVERPRLRAEEAIDASVRVQPARFDAILLLLGLTDVAARTPPARFREAMSALIESLLAATALGTRVFVGGIPSTRSSPAYDTLLGRRAEAHARVLEQQLIGLCEGEDRVEFVPLPAPRPTGGREPRTAAAQYALWAGLVADAVAPALDGPYRLDGERRQRSASHAADGSIGEAVAELVRERGAPDDRLHSIVDLAKRAFQSDTAFIALLGDETEWTVVRSRTDLPALPDMSAFCTAAMLGDGALVVRDAQTDERLADDPAVAAPRGVRFFIGYPIESPSGLRTGVIGVHDSAPRRRDSDVLDEVFLQELAILAQQALGPYFA